MIAFLLAVSMFYMENKSVIQSEVTFIQVEKKVISRDQPNIVDSESSEDIEINELFFVEDSYTNEVIILDRNGELVKKIKVGNAPHDIAASPDGRLVVTANHGGGNISIIDTTTLRLVNTVTTGSGAHGVAFSPDGDFLFVANEIEGTVSILDTNNFSRQNKVAIGAFPEYIAVTLDGSKIITTNLSGQGSLTILEYNGLQTSKFESIDLMIDPHGISFSPSGAVGVVTNFSSSSTFLLDGLTLEVLKSIDTGDYSEFATFYSDQELWTTHIGSHDITVIDVEENVVLDQITVGETPHGITFSYDKKFAYVPLFESGEVVIIDVLARRVIKKVRVGIELHNSVMVQIR